MTHSDKISKSCTFYGDNLNRLRAAWYADPDNAKFEERYKRFSARWHRESKRLCDGADALLGR